MTNGKLGAKPDWADWIDVAKAIGTDPITMAQPENMQWYYWGRDKLIAEWEAEHPDGE